jgi:hypothetical protein
MAFDNRFRPLVTLLTGGGLEVSVDCRCDEWSAREERLMVELARAESEGFVGEGGRQEGAAEVFDGDEDREAATWKTLGRRFDGEGERDELARDCA